MDEGTAISLSTEQDFGPGAYGGPADERIASAVEREALKMAGWRETALKTLWIPPARISGGLFSVDEALNQIAETA
ncbi:MAG: hypothetical protein ACRDPE_15260 [Solirubrobacterales bacterium]